MLSRGTLPPRNGATPLLEMTSSSLHLAQLGDESLGEAVGEEAEGIASAGRLEVEHGDPAGIVSRGHGCHRVAATARHELPPGDAGQGEEHRDHRLGDEPLPARGRLFRRLELLDRGCPRPTARPHDLRRGAPGGDRNLLRRPRRVGARGRDVRSSDASASASPSASANSFMLGYRSAGVFSSARKVASSTASGIEFRTTCMLGTCSSEWRARTAMAFGPSNGGWPTSSS